MATDDSTQDTQASPPQERPAPLSHLGRADQALFAGTNITSNAEAILSMLIDTFPSGYPRHEEALYGLQRLLRQAIHELHAAEGALRAARSRRRPLSKQDELEESVMKALRAGTLQLVGGRA